MTMGDGRGFFFESHWPSQGCSETDCIPGRFFTSFSGKSEFTYFVVVVVVEKTNTDKSNWIWNCELFTYYSFKETQIQQLKCCMQQIFFGYCGSPLATDAV